MFTRTSLHIRPRADMEVMEDMVVMEGTVDKGDKGDKVVKGVKVVKAVKVVMEDMEDMEVKEDLAAGEVPKVKVVLVVLAALEGRVEMAAHGVLEAKVDLVDLVKMERAAVEAPAQRAETPALALDTQVLMRTPVLLLLLVSWWLSHLWRLFSSRLYSSVLYLLYDVFYKRVAQTSECPNLQVHQICSQHISTKPQKSIMKIKPEIQMSN
jgi:hypothetical protein